MGKQINSKANKSITTTTQALRTLIGTRYTATKYVVPGFKGEMVVEIAVLKRREREAIIDAVKRPDGSWDNLLQNRMCVAYGLIEPRILPDTPFEDPDDPAVHESYVKQVTEELLEYPDAFIDPIAAKIWEMSNEDETRRGGSKGTPFLRTNGSLSGSSTGPESTPTS